MTAIFNRVVERINALQKLTHLHCHIQSVTIHSWTAIAKCIETTATLPSNEDAAEPHCGTDTAASLLLAADEGIAVLLLQLPRLRRLRIYNSPITISLHSYILSNKQLMYLTIGGCDISEETTHIVQSPATLAVRDLTILWAPSMLAELYFSQLLTGCVRNLESLHVFHSIIPWVLVAAAKRPLPLRHLVVALDKEETSAALLRLLPLCAHLRDFKVYLSDSSFSLGSLPHDALPNLAFVTGRSDMVRKLVPGRPVSGVVITISPREEKPWSLDVLQRSTVPIESVRVAYRCEALDESLTSIRSLYALSHLSHLSMCFYSQEEKVSIMTVRVAP
jgi:hypothetical protein